MEYKENAFPIQKLSRSKKNKEWIEDCIDYIIGQSHIANSYDLPDSDELQTYYDLYNGIYNEKDLKYVTNPFDQEDGFPASAQNFNILRQRVDLLIGEETKRPDNIFVWRTSQIANSQMQDQAKRLLLDYATATIMADMGEEERARYEQALATGEIMAPEQISSYLTKDYKDIVETTAYHTLKYLQTKLNIKNTFVNGWKDALIAGLEIYYIGVRNGLPVVERINPKNFTFEYNEGLEYIHDAGWCCYKMNMSVPQVYDTFYDELDEKDLDKLLDLTGGNKKGEWGPISGRGADFFHDKLKVKEANHAIDIANIDVYHVNWTSYKKIGFVTLLDPETMTPVEYKVDEYYKPTGQELKVEWTWVIEKWRGYKAGDDIFFGGKPLDNQYESSVDLNSARNEYTGAVYSATNSKSKSLVAILKPLQYQYIVAWYRLQLAMARDKGKVLTMDITQIPQAMNVDVSKWLHYLSALGVNFVNPYDTSWDVLGREGGKASQFNQIAAVDLSMSNTISQYLEIIFKLEDMMADLSGVTKQRQGAISSNELVGNVERSVIQSAHITEPWFWVHNQVKKEVLTMLLNTAKFLWRGSDDEYLHYVLDDATRAFLKMAPDFPYEDFDVFVTDSTKEHTVLEQARQLIQPAMQNGASLADAIELLAADNLNMIKSKLTDLENDRIAREQAMREQEQMMQQQLADSQNQIKEQELLLKQAELDLTKYKVDADNATKITVAQLQAYRGTDNLDQDMNGIPDPIEIGKAAIEQQKVTAEIGNKRLEALGKQREIELKSSLENRKLTNQKESERMKSTIEHKKVELEKEKLKMAKELQKMKDDAAMAREKLKATTALKNKTVGEK